MRYYSLPRRRAAHHRTCTSWNSGATCVIVTPYVIEEASPFRARLGHWLQGRVEPSWPTSRPYRRPGTGFAVNGRPAGLESPRWSSRVTHQEGQSITRISSPCTFPRRHFLCATDGSHSLTSICLSFFIRVWSSVSPYQRAIFNQKRSNPENRPGSP